MRSSRVKPVALSPVAVALLASGCFLTRGGEPPPPDCRVAPPSHVCQPARVQSCESPNSCTPGHPCCALVPIAGGRFARGWDTSGSDEEAGVPVVGFQPSGAAPARLRDFAIDQSEVSVARFARFMARYGRWRFTNPLPDSGALFETPGSGWQEPPAGAVPMTTEAQRRAIVSACPDLAVPLRDDAETGAAVPMACVTWYEASLFCLWDGARLPTEAEWNFVASDGDHQRAFPSPDSDTKGLADGVREWTLDRAGDASPEGLATYAESECDHCVALSGVLRIVRGAADRDPMARRRTGYRAALTPTTRSAQVGFRCARDEPI